MPKDRISKDYEDGVENFIAFAVQNSANQMSMSTVWKFDIPYTSKD